MNGSEFWDKYKTVIFFIALNIFVLIYLLTSAQKYETQCNTHWQNQIVKVLEDNHCIVTDIPEYVPFNTTYNIIGDYGED
jgi:hypothetical protein